MGRSSLRSLHAVVGPCGNPGGLFSCSGGDGDFVPRAVRDQRSSVGLLGDVQVPNTILVTLVRILSSVPSVEISHQSQILGARSPFGCDDARALRIFAVMDTIGMKALRKLLQRAESVDDMLLSLLVPSIAVLQGALAPLKVRVPLDNFAAVFGPPVVVGDLMPWHVFWFLQGPTSEFASSLTVGCRRPFCRGGCFSSSQPQGEIAADGQVVARSR
mmetsp:Transcript_13740/g.31731  ORF Transcript_13740/g.31731 Transcript_13740/m.31731 type:complete len:216 (+) Transcript_13740:1788-2435(+)